MRKLKHFYTTDTKIILAPGAGDWVTNCIREALIVSLEEWCAIEFNFNGNLYSIDGTKLVDKIYAEVQAK